MKLDAAARTHVGSVRTQNEDAFVCRPEHGLFAVVDGMGGQEAGEVAAAIAAETLAEVPPDVGLASETLLASAMRGARLRILDEVNAHPEWEGMGAVATALRFDDDGRQVSLAHVGDTRAYLVGASGLRQLTRDHLGPAAEDGGKRRVSRDLGSRQMEGDWVETHREPVGSGDMLVLASDGLTDAVSEADLSKELVGLRRAGAPAEAIATRLIGLALAGGGPDNVTVIVVRVGDFRRGSRQVRAWPFAVGAVAVLAVAAALSWPRAPEPVGLPAEVAETTTVDGADTVAVPPGLRTAVATGSVLTVRGVRLTGADWTVTVADGATLTLDRCVIDLDGALRIEGADGAQVLVQDTRLGAGRLVLSGTAAAAFTLVHTRIEPEALVVEGTPRIVTQP